MKPKSSIDLIITRGNKILFGKLSKKWTCGNKYKWGLPGRDIKKDKNFEWIVKNNLKEELEMELKSFKIICRNNNFGFGNNYVSFGIIVKAKGQPKLIKPEDWEEWKWFKKNKIPNKLFPSAELTINCFLRNKINARLS